MEYKYIPIPKLPWELKQTIHRQIRLYSVTMLARENAPSEAFVAAATLCRIGECRGIVTARHVWDVLRHEETVALLARQSRVRISPTHLRSVVPPPSGQITPNSCEIPDIAFLELPVVDCGRLEATGKTFYNIDRRLPDSEAIKSEMHGYWAFYGAPQVLLNRDSGAVPSFIYGTSVTQRENQGGWDYLTVALDVEKNPLIPRDYRGASGGGVWRTPYWTDEAARRFQIDDQYHDVFFSGVNFYQTDRGGGELIAHGPMSIYERLYAEVKNSNCT